MKKTIEHCTVLNGIEKISFFYRPIEVQILKKQDNFALKRQVSYRYR